MNSSTETMLPFIQIKCLGSMAREAIMAEDATVTTEERRVTVVNKTLTTKETTSTAKDTMVVPQESTATKEEATTSNSAHKRDQDAKTPDVERMYTDPLPEYELLQGHFFAREADAPCDQALTASTEDVFACPTVLEVTVAGVQAAEEAAVDQAEEVYLTDSETEIEA